jgi:hypothetical protein
MEVQYSDKEVCPLGRLILMKQQLDKSGMGNKLNYWSCKSPSYILGKYEGVLLF